MLMDFSIVALGHSTLENSIKFEWKVFGVLDTNSAFRVKQFVSLQGGCVRSLNLETSDSGWSLCYSRYMYVLMRIYLSVLTAQISNTTLNYYGILSRTLIFSTYSEWNCLKLTLGIFILAYMGIQDAVERCGQTLGTSSAYQNKKKCLYQHVPRNIWFFI
jgi:hypothetical protein